jgi:hypothetical protein
MTIGNHTGTKAEVEQRKVTGAQNSDLNGGVRDTTQMRRLEIERF